MLPHQPFGGHLLRTGQQTRGTRLGPYHFSEEMSAG